MTTALMRRREASINDVSIAESNRKFFWPAPGPRPADYPGIPDIRWDPTSQNLYEVSNHERTKKDSHRDRSFPGDWRGHRESVRRTGVQRRCQFPEGDPIHRGRGF